MIMVVSVGIVLALAVGGFIMAANSLGDQDQCLIDDPQKIVLDNIDFDLVETAQPLTLRELDFVLESEIQSQLFYLSQRDSSSLCKLSYHTSYHTSLPYLLVINPNLA